MSTHAIQNASSFAPNWSADELVAAVPQTMPALHSFVLQPPANAAALHRPRRVAPAYVANTALMPFRVRG
jgi:hypothetical protein